MKTSHKATLYCSFEHYELEVPIGCFNSEEEASGAVERTKVIVEHKLGDPGITLLRDGEEIFVGADELLLQVLSADAQSRLGQALDVSVAREKKMAVEALEAMDPAYVVTEADFITVSGDKVSEFLTHCGDGCRLHVSSYRVSAETIPSDNDMGDVEKLARFSNRVLQLKLSAGMSIVPQKLGQPNLLTDRPIQRTIDEHRTSMIMQEVIASCWRTDFEEGLAKAEDGTAFLKMDMKRFREGLSLFMDRIAPGLEMEQSANDWTSLGNDSVTIWFNMHDPERLLRPDRALVSKVNFLAFEPELDDDPWASLAEPEWLSCGQDNHWEILTLLNPSQFEWSRDFLEFSAKHPYGFQAVPGWYWEMPIGAVLAALEEKRPCDTEAVEAWCLRLQALNPDWILRCTAHQKRWTLINHLKGDYQKRAGDWASACFGADGATDEFHRRNRFIEEAIELHQAAGGTLDEIIQLVHHVYNKPVGDPHQEVGGTMVTLATLCNALGVDLLHAGEDELARVWEEFPRIRAKQAAAKDGSPLPGVLENEVQP